MAKSSKNPARWHGASKALLSVLLVLITFDITRNIHDTGVGFFKYFDKYIIDYALDPIQFITFLFVTVWVVYDRASLVSARKKLHRFFAGRKRHWLLHFFDSFNNDRSAIRIFGVIPEFSPLSRDLENSGTDRPRETRFKRPIDPHSAATQSADDQVPMFSDVAVIDDFYAFRKFDQLFSTNIGKNIELFTHGDFHTAFGPGDDFDINTILIGGPRSNPYTASVMKRHLAHFITLHHGGGQVTDDWSLRITVGGKNHDYSATAKHGIGAIIRTHGRGSENHFILFGDTGETTYCLANAVSRHFFTLYDWISDGALFDQDYAAVFIIRRSTDATLANPAPYRRRIHSFSLSDRADQMTDIRPLLLATPDRIVRPGEDR